jgi:hypothetical protein
MKGQIERQTRKLLMTYDYEIYCKAVWKTRNDKWSDKTKTYTIVSEQ